MGFKKNKEFGPEHGVLNLSKLGFRYFRIMLNVSSKTKQKLSKELIFHPNVGWLFTGKGWFNLAIGIFAKNNSEINDLSTIIRKLLSEKDKVIYQSELTYLVSFGNFENKKSEMIIIDSKDKELELSPIEIDFLKLYSIDSTIKLNEYSKILGIEVNKLKKIKNKLEKNKIIVGTQKRLNYKYKYFKVFVDTATVKEEILNLFISKLYKDKNCIFYERANGKYDLEFEIILEDKKLLLEKYLNIFKEYKIAILNKNLYTNLFPQTKVSNIKEIKDIFLNQKISKTYNLVNSKLWYLNYLGTNAYLSIYSSNKYKNAMNTPETSLFPNVIKFFKKNNEKYNLIDLGSGDGTKAKKFIETLGEKNILAYYPVDIQSIEISTVLQVHKNNNYPIHPTIIDFEKLNSRFPIRNNPNEKDLYIFLGGTYGNFKIDKINSYLKPLVENKSILLIAMPIRDNTTIKELIKSYSNNFMEEITFGPLKQLGFEKDDFENNYSSSKLKVKLEFIDNCIKTYYILNKEKTIEGRKIKKGTRFDITSSWKPSLEEFKSGLEKDFKIEKIISNKYFAYAICSKK